MRHSVTIDEEIGKQVEDAAREQGISISEFYARAAEERVRQFRRRKIIEEFDRRAGKIEAHEDLDAAIKEMRADDPGRF